MQIFIYGYNKMKICNFYTNNTDLVLKDCPYITVYC